MKRLLISLMVGFTSIASAQTVPLDHTTKAPSGLLLPRFVSISAGEANMRTGPGDRYPIQWVYLRRHHPLQITAEYGAWRRVSDIEGTTGWMHSALLSGRRTGVVTGGTRTLYKSADPTSRPVLKAEEGVSVRIIKCDGSWCRLEIAEQKGWMPQDNIWGTYSRENVR